MKAVVLSIQGRQAVLLTPDGRFLRRTLPQAVAVGEEVELEPWPRALWARPVPLAAAATFLALLLVLSLRLAPLALAHTVLYVALEGRVHMRLGVSRLGAVTETVAEDRRAEGLVRRLHVIGLPLPLALQKILGMERQGGYLQRRDRLLLAVYPVRRLVLTRGLEKELLATERSARRSVGEGSQIYTVIAPLAVVRVAAAEGLTPVDYTIYQLLRSEGLPATPAAVHSERALRRALAHLTDLRIGPPGGKGAGRLPGRRDHLVVHARLDAGLLHALPSDDDHVQLIVPETSAELGHLAKRSLAGQAVPAGRAGEGRQLGKESPTPVRLPGTESSTTGRPEHQRRSEAGVGGPTARPEGGTAIHPLPGAGAVKAPAGKRSERGEQEPTEGRGGRPRQLGRRGEGSEHGRQQATPAIPRHGSGVYPLPSGILQGGQVPLPAGPVQGEGQSRAGAFPARPGRHPRHQGVLERQAPKGGTTNRPAHLPGMPSASDGALTPPAAPGSPGFPGRAQLRGRKGWR